MTRTFATVANSAISGLLLQTGTARAEEIGVAWKALQAAKISLEKGLAVAQQKGKPISGKFEVDDGKLQLSTYTVRKGKFSLEGGKLVAAVVLENASGTKNVSE